MEIRTSDTKVILAIAGTRPEVLKLAPVLRELRTHGAGQFLTKTCFSGQHREILESVLGDIDLHPDVEYRSPAVDLTLSQKLARLLKHLSAAIASIRPHGVLVQGDTNTVFAGALAAFYAETPVFHVEAGLRTSTATSPFPEEINRRLVSQLASLHFTPTERARQNLLQEGFDPARVVTTGNTIIDTMHIYGGTASPDAEAILGQCRPDSRRLLVTLHRRENRAKATEVTTAVRRIVMRYPDVEVLWVLHLNEIRPIVIREMCHHASVRLLEPQSYKTFVHLMKGSYLILTDSGGVQEEAPSLGKPVLVLRDETERPEAVDIGSAEVVGCHADRIVSACCRLLDDREAYARMSRPANPFGDGHASSRILAALRSFYRSGQLSVGGMDVSVVGRGPV